MQVVRNARVLMSRAVRAVRAVLCAVATAFAVPTDKTRQYNARTQTPILYTPYQSSTLTHEQ